jgi:peroxidase
LPLIKIDILILIDNQGIIAKQFRDLKFGDRFFYENGNDEATRLSLEQLNEIKKSSLSRIICDNTDLKVIQMNPFMFTSERANPLVDCKSIKKVSYLPWKI